MIKVLLLIFKNFVFAQIILYRFDFFFLNGIRNIILINKLIVQKINIYINNISIIISIFHEIDFISFTT